MGNEFPGWAVVLHINIEDFLYETVNWEETNKKFEKVLSEEVEKVLPSIELSIDKQKRDEPCTIIGPDGNDAEDYCLISKLIKNRVGIAVERTAARIKEWYVRV